MSEAERRAALIEADYNLLRIPNARVPFDLFSDVPHRVLVPDADRGADEASPEDICAALAPLTGDARLALATKGRSAESALVDALELAGPPVVLTHGLFATTQTALARRGAVLEDAPLAKAAGSADLDLDRLDERLGKGGVALVYLELANNALFGWPVSGNNIARIRESCDRHGAKLVLDAARPLANAAAGGAEDVVGSARRVLALAHAFTISCAKELLVPIGSVLGSSDAALVGRANMLLFRAGTSMTPIDPPQHRADLRDGARYSLAHPDLVRDRLTIVKELATDLAARGVSVVEPATSHAVYLTLDRALLPANDVAAMIGVMSHLYLVAGVRGQITMSKRGPAMRLAVPLCMQLDGKRRGELVDGVAAFFARIAERPALRVIDGQLDVPYFRRLGLA